MDKYIEILNRFEAEHHIHWDRPRENEIVFSKVGYNHMDLTHLEEELLKNGLQYDFSKDDFKTYDQVCGRTFVYMKVRK